METSLIEEFSYPKLGPGQLWELTASAVEEKGGKVLLNTQAVGVIKKGNRITGVKVVENERERHALNFYLSGPSPGLGAGAEEGRQK